jgi:hypothetical protein
MTKHNRHKWPFRAKRTNDTEATTTRRKLHISTYLEELAIKAVQQQ